MMSLFHKNPAARRTDDGVKLITVARPNDPVAEQFRTIRTNIHFVAVDQELKTIAFSSANQNEGKSTTAANVAVTWALEGKKVLFIDADLRRPVLNRTFGLDNRQGLTTILSSRANAIELSDYIKPTGIDNLAVITSGPIPPNPSELLGSTRMATLIQNVSQAFDIVVLDVPPILEVPDTQVLSAHLNGLVLVVREGQTRKDAIAQAVQALKISKTRILGFVLNDHDSKDAGYGYGYGYTAGKGLQ